MENTGIQFNRIVIWGLKKRYHTHRHIHEAFYKNATKLGYKTIWVEDEKKNQKYIEPGDLIIASEVHGKMVPEKINVGDYNLPIREDVKYCLHNFQDIFKEKLPKNNFINLQVYSEELLDKNVSEKWSLTTFFDKKTRTLYQPWGTDLLPHEFKKPVFSNSKVVFWIGSVWNDRFNRGNINEIDELKKILKRNDLKFINLRFVPDFLNTFFVRISRIAPAIAGKFQVDVNYLPCRMFKNISYGQLGITNVRKFKEILGEYFIDGENMEKILENSISLSKDEYLEKVKGQQKIIEKYTYKNSLENIIKALSLQTNT
jgi:hypothetical protein